MKNHALHFHFSFANKSQLKTRQEGPKVEMSRVLAVAAGTLALFCLLAHTCDALLFFYLPTNREQCFQHEAVRYSFEDSVKVDAHYKVRNTESVRDGQIIAVVRNPTKMEIYRDKLNLDGRDQFSFPATITGTYHVCLLLQGTNNPAAVELQIESERDASAIASTSGKISATMQEYNEKITTVQNYILTAKQEADYLSERQERFDKTVASTYSRVMWFTVINFVVMVGASVWQVLSLKRFFKEKKIV